jgi:hypothetical protein
MSEPQERRQVGWFGLHAPGRRPVVLLRYLTFVLPANLAWEILQLPLFTLWQKGTPREKVWDVVHCTGGDVLIAFGSLLLGVIVAGGRRWPKERYWRAAAVSTAIGVSYTIWSEWLNTSIRESWTYSPWMPVVPVLRVGLSPLAQWIVIPLVGFWWAHRIPSSPSPKASRNAP